MPQSMAMDEFKGALAHAPIGVLIVDVTGTVAWSNAAAAALMGSHDPEMLWHSDLEPWLDPQDAVTLRRMFALHFSAAAPNRKSHTCRLGLPSGTDAPRRALWTLAPLAEKSGRHAILFLQDAANDPSPARGIPLYFQGELGHLAPSRARMRPLKGPAFLERLG